MKTKAGGILKILIFFSIGIILIWLSFKDLSSSDIEKIKQSFVNANYWWLFLSVLINILSHVIRAQRWKMLARPMGYETKFSNSFFAVMVGYLVNYGVPRLGEISRCTVISKYEKIPFTKVLGTVIAERVLDMIFFFIIFMVMILTQYEKISNYLSHSIYPPIHDKLQSISANKASVTIISITGVLLLCLLFFFRKKISNALSGKIKNFIKGLSEGLMSVKKVESPINFVFQTALIWILYYLGLHICFYSLPEFSSFDFDKGLTAFVFGSFTVMITPGGIGAYPYALQKVMFLVYGINEAVGASLGWLTWVISFVAIVSTGVMSFVLLPIMNKNYEPRINESENKA
jgi:uncharacterized protein (TIRG00374 family)